MDYLKAQLQNAVVLKGDNSMKYLNLKYFVIRKPPSGGNSNGKIQ